MKAGILIQPLKNGKDRHFLISIPINVSPSGAFTGYVVSVPPVILTKNNGRAVEFSFEIPKPFIATLDRAALAGCTVKKLPSYLERVAVAALELAAKSIPTQRKTAVIGEKKFSLLDPLKPPHTKAHQLRWNILGIYFAMTAAGMTLRQDAAKFTEFYKKYFEKSQDGVTEEAFKKASQEMGIRFPKSSGKK